MKVLIVGSTHNLAPDVTREGFIQACRDIGTSLAEAGVEIVIGSDGENTADRYVLEGVAKVAGKHKVWVLRPASEDTPFADRPAWLNEQIVFKYSRLHGPWSAGRVPQILAADSVLLIGGGKGTAGSGYVAPALERPVLAIASFGGGAAELWPYLERYYSQLGELSDQVGALRERWQTKNADLAVRVLKDLVRRQLFRRSPRLPIGIYLVLLLLCLGGWVALFAFPPPNHTAWPFFAMLGVAGILGTLLRNNLRLIFDHTAVFSWDELIIEIGAGLILGFALSLLYFVGVVTITGGTDSVLSPSQVKPGDFQRVAIVMTLLGIGGGLMIEQAADRVQGWFTERFRIERE